MTSPECCNESRWDVMMYCVICGARLCAGHSEVREDGCNVCRLPDGSHYGTPFTFTCAVCGMECVGLPKGVDGMPPPPFGVYERVLEWKEPPSPAKYHCRDCAMVTLSLWWRRP